MRIITGMAKGRALLTPEGLETRPTSERAKEAIFSMLQFELEGRRILDLFAGSGQMGLEAVSRGAASAVLVDRSPKAFGVLEKNIAKTGLSAQCRAVCADYADFLARSRETFDIVFLDPPYAGGVMGNALRMLYDEGHLSSVAVLVCESDVRDILQEEPGLAMRYEVQKLAKYGIAQVTLLRQRKQKGE